MAQSFLLEEAYASVVDEVLSRVSSKFRHRDIMMLYSTCARVHCRAHVRMLDR